MFQNSGRKLEKVLAQNLKVLKRQPVNVETSVTRFGKISQSLKGLFSIWQFFILLWQFLILLCEIFVF